MYTLLQNISYVQTLEIRGKIYWFQNFGSQRGHEIRGLEYQLAKRQLGRFRSHSCAINAIFTYVITPHLLHLCKWHLYTYIYTCFTSTLLLGNNYGYCFCNLWTESG